MTGLVACRMVIFNRYSTLSPSLVICAIECRHRHRDTGIQRHKDAWRYRTARRDAQKQRRTETERCTEQRHGDTETQRDTGAQGHTDMRRHRDTRKGTVAHRDTETNAKTCRHMETQKHAEKQGEAGTHRNITSLPQSPLVPRATRKLTAMISFRILISIPVVVVRRTL